MSKPVLLNVCILPPKDIALQCIDLSRSFDNSHVRFKLGDGLFPHSTVYMTRFEEERIEDVVGVFSKMNQHLRSIALTHTGYFLTEGKYLEVSYAKTKQVLAFQKTVIEALKALRASSSTLVTESFHTSFNEVQSKNLLETGYDLAFELYRPHITLTRYNEGVELQTFPAFPETQLSFDASRIALYKADENGAVYEEITVLDLL